MIERNRLKEKLKAGQVAIGGWVGIGHPDVVEVWANVGFDFIVFDMEHCALCIDTVERMLQATSGTDTVPMVRMAWNNPLDLVSIRQVLDAGAWGIILPHVISQEDAIKAVQACKYPPIGMRGIGPRRASKYYLEIKEYIKVANKEIMVIPLIEHIDAVNNIDKILSVSGIDAYMIGHWDLSASMGLLDELVEGFPDIWAPPKAMEAINKVHNVAKKAGVFAGIWGGSVEFVKRHIDQGYQFISLGEETDYLLKAKGDLQKIREYLREKS